MNALKTLFIIKLFLFALGCEFLQPPEVDDDFDFNSPSYDCNYTAKTTYNVGTDVTTNFDESNVSASTTILATNCYWLNVGDTTASTVNRLYRSGNTITYVGADGNDTITVSGTNLSYANQSGCVDSDIYMSMKFVEGKINAGNTSFYLTLKAYVDLDYCSRNYSSRAGQNTQDGFGSSLAQPVLDLFLP